MSWTLGSTLLSTPEESYIDKQFLYHQWNVPIDGLEHNERVHIVKKSILDSHTKILIWLDVFGPIFSKEIHDDAKRILYDFRMTGFLNKIKEQFCALICLNIACQFHGVDMLEKKRAITIARGRGRRIFGLKVKNYSPQSTMFRNLKKYTEMAIDTLPDDKFEMLRNMHEKIGDVNG